ncbi:MAG TPA: TIGR02611 family protein [Pseudonocardiaceae bacterium]
MNDRVGHDHWYTRFRERVRRRSGIDLAYRIMVGVVGAAVFVVGVIAIPYPGPGWLILFAGLAILGTEFHWAQRVLQWVRDRYDSWMDWTRQQSPLVRLAAVALTGVVVLVTLWLVDAFGLVAGWVGLDWDWVRSPFA